MANGYYRDVIIDNYGRPLTGVTITVYLTGTLTPATLFSNRAGSLSLNNPFTNESGDGSFEFWADTTNRYDIAFSKSGITFDNTDYTDVDVGFLPDGAITTAKIADGAVTDVKVTSITTRSKLPSQLAYEDEANTFTQDQTIAKSTASLTINDTSGSAEGRLKLARSGTGRTLRDNGTEFQIVNAAFTDAIFSVDNTGKITVGIVPLARMASATMINETGATVAANSITITNLDTTDQFYSAMVRSTAGVNIFESAAAFASDDTAITVNAYAFFYSANTGQKQHIVQNNNDATTVTYNRKVYRLQET